MKSKIQILALMLVGIMLSVNQVLATEYSDKLYTFGSTITSGGSTNGTLNSSYYKMNSGNYAEITAASMFGSELLSSNTMSIKVGCGTFGTWSNPKTIKLTAQFLDSEGNELSKSEHTTSGLGGNTSYATAFTIAKPTNPEKIAKLKITFSNFSSTSSGCARLGSVKLTYSTSSAGSTYTLYLYDATNGNTVGVSGKSGSHDAVKARTAYSSLASGTKLTLTNTPASGYQFDEWTVMDEESNDLSSCLDGNQITMPAKDVHVYPSFSSVSACNTKPTLGTTSTAGSSTPSTVTLQWPNGITSKGEEECEITSYGFVYGTGENPALDGSGNAISGYTKVEVGTTTPTLNQQITHTVEGLQSGTQVYFRFYATNAAGTTVSSTKGSAATSSLQDQFFDNVQESDGYTGVGHTEYNAYTVPSLSDKTPATEGSCEQVHYHFVGWVSEANKLNPTDSNIIPAGGSTRATGANYYAVWAKEE